MITTSKAVKRWTFWNRWTDSGSKTCLLQGWNVFALPELSIPIPLVDGQDPAFVTLAVLELLAEKYLIKQIIPFWHWSQNVLGATLSTGWTLSKQEIAFFVLFFCSHLICNSICSKTRSPVVLELLRKKSCPEGTGLLALFSGVSMVLLLFPLMFPVRTL